MPALADLVAPYTGVTLSDSKTLYPKAQGSGLPLIRIDTALCQAVVAPQGAQLLSFTSAQGTPLLWLSPECRFEEGTALRGGIPVCLPWFGPHPDANKPQHGFARTSDWALRRVAQADDGRCELYFELEHEGDDRFEQNFTGGLRMVLGKQIELELSLTNDSPKPADFTWALHSYLPVEALDTVRVPVLAGRDYLDNLENHARHTQSGPLAFEGEVDRVYPDMEKEVILEPRPRIRLSHENCPSLITWNPGPEKAADMADMGRGKERGFVCLERGAVLDEGWTLAPGEARSGKLIISAA